MYLAFENVAGNCDLCCIGNTYKWGMRSDGDISSLEDRTVHIRPLVCIGMSSAACAQYFQTYVRGGVIVIAYIFELFVSCRGNSVDVMHRCSLSTSYNILTKFPTF
jgi:hypothetical protein